MEELLERNSRLEAALKEARYDCKRLTAENEELRMELSTRV